MEDAAGRKNEIRQKFDQQQQFIPGLPADIGMECLVRVPCRFHSTMKSVCRGWRTLISHPSFYGERRKLRSAEHLVCLVQALPPHAPHHVSNTSLKEAKDKTHCPPLYGLSIYNATHRTWHRMMLNCGFGSGIPMFCHCVALPSSAKLLLLGGWNPTTLEPLPDVYVIDFRGGGFRRAAPMSVGRSFFACAAVGPSRVYVAGGHDNLKNALRSAEVYDADEDEWRTLPAMEEERDECQGLCWEGDSRFWVVSGYSTESQGRFRSDAECYDPATGCWSRVDGVWPYESISPRGTTAAVSDGKHYQQWWWFLRGEQQNGEERDKSWKVVNSIPLPEGMGGSSPCVTSLGGGGVGGGGYNNRMFVMGGGGRASSSSSCSECDGEGAFVLERDSSGNKWNHIHTPPNFSAFPYSASYLLI